MLLLAQVESIERSLVAGVIPNAITVVSGGRRYFFASFVKRDNVFDSFSRIWKEGKDGFRVESREVVFEAGDRDGDSVVTGSVDVGLDTQMVVEADTEKKAGRIRTRVGVMMSLGFMIMFFLSLFTGQTHPNTQERYS